MVEKLIELTECVKSADNASLGTEGVLVEVVLLETVHGGVCDCDSL